METLRLSRATHRELERYNDRQEQTDGTDS
jgi:hypothetical protein